MKFFESSRRPNGWGGWRQRAKAPETLGLEYGVSELFFFFGLHDAMWIFRESINFFNHIPTETRVIWDPWVLQNLEAIHVFVLFFGGVGVWFFQ